MKEMNEMKDCRIIKEILMDCMILGRRYDLDELYKMVANYAGPMTDQQHKVRAVLEGRNLVGRYYVKYYGDAEYSLERASGDANASGISGILSSKKEVA